jgi:hypothetical protein
MAVCMKFQETMWKQDTLIGTSVKDRPYEHLQTCEHPQTPLTLERMKIFYSKEAKPSNKDRLNLTIVTSINCRYRIKLFPWYPDW